MKRILKILNQKYVQYVVVFFLVGCFFISSSLFVFKRNNIFPIINGLIMFLFAFIYRGKFRIYSLMFFSTMGPCLTLIDSKIGSFLSWNILFYFIISVFERIIKKRDFNSNELCALFYFALFAIYGFLIDLTNLSNVSLIKFASLISHFSIPVIAILNEKGNISISKIIKFYTICLLVSNYYFLAFIFKKSIGLKFLDAYVPTFKVYYEAKGFLTFRFPGFDGDPNHNAIYLLMGGLLLLMTMIKSKQFNFVNFLIIVLLQIPAILGGSKAYFITVIILLLILAIYFLRKGNGTKFALGLATLILSFSIIFVAYFNKIPEAVLRLLNVDGRGGRFLDQITSNRLGVWINYFCDGVSNPFRFVFGHGVWVNKLYGTNYHNLLLQMLWEFGIVGSLFLMLYIKSFIGYHNSKKIKIIDLAPILILIIFSFSLHILYDDRLYIILYIYSVFLGVEKNGEINYDMEVSSNERKNSAYLQINI